MSNYAKIFSGDNINSAKPKVYNIMEVCESFVNANFSRIMMQLTMKRVPLERSCADLLIDGFFWPGDVSALEIVAFEKYSHPGAIPPGFWKVGTTKFGTNYPTRGARNSQKQWTMKRWTVWVEGLLSVLNVLRVFAKKWLLGVLNGLDRLAIRIPFSLFTGDFGLPPRDVSVISAYYLCLLVCACLPTLSSYFFGRAYCSTTIFEVPLDSHIFVFTDRGWIRIYDFPVITWSGVLPPTPLQKKVVVLYTH